MYSLPQYNAVLHSNCVFYVWHFVLRDYKEENKSETRVTATLKKKKKNAVYYDKSQHANFRGKPPFQATKQHLDNSSQMVKNEMYDTHLLLVKLFCCVVLFQKCWHDYCCMTLSDCLPG